MGVGVAQGATISSRPTFDCAKAKSPLALLICLSGEETARADWDFFSGNPFRAAPSEALSRRPSVYSTDF
jgi:hypothetical protein